MCQKLRQKDKMGINGKFNENKTRMNSFLLQFEEENVQKGWKKGSRCWFVILERERESCFSLAFSPFGPSVRFGPRSKAVLRGEGYAWTPIWWSSDNSKR